MSLDAFMAMARMESARFRGEGQTAETARAAQARARAAGKHIGRPPTTQQEVLEFLRAHGTVTASHITASIHQPRNSVASALRALARDGKAERLDTRDENRAFYWAATDSEDET